MQTKLIIYLHAQDLLHPSWVLLEDERIVDEVRYGEFSRLEQIKQTDETIVIVPAEDVSLLTVTLPKMNKMRLRQALPFAIEDQVIDEITSLHLVPGVQNADGTVAVAVVAQTKMAEWKALFAKLPLDKMIPAPLALPYVENTWQILLLDEAAVRTGLLQGFGCDLINLNHLLQLSLDISENPPNAIQIFNTQNTEVNLQLTIQWQVEALSLGKFLAEKVTTASKDNAINLLQGTYATKKTKLPHKQKLIKVLVATSLSIGLFMLVSPFVSYYLLHKRSQEINVAITQIYKQNFPQAKNVVAPKLRMQEKLRKLANNVGENKLLMLLGYVANGMETNRSIKLNRFDFQNNQLTLDLKAESSEDFSAFAAYLQQQGFKTKQQNINLASDSRMSATLIIE